ncbi:MAG: cupin domain-containing protein, partial [Pyrinomonadaceae bacterium]
DNALTHARASATEDWITGRAGMEYRDLIPDRMDGEVIASHIRLTKGGEVPDYVHYHKVDFQLIRCLKGRIKVVYEDQGEPFWLEPGDYVIQPPEIRHRVLECTEGSEVMEISIPAEHETWIDHEMTLPTRTVNPERLFSGQRFVHHLAEKEKEPS